VWANHRAIGDDSYHQSDSIRRLRLRDDDVVRRVAVAVMSLKDGGAPAWLETQQSASGPQADSDSG
jgi:hypothetical protein